MKNRIAALPSQPAPALAFAERSPLPGIARQFINRRNPPGADACELLTVDQIAAKIGCCRATVERMTKRRLIPAIRMSRRFIRYRWRDVEKALEKVTVWEVA